MVLEAEAFIPSWLLSPRPPAGSSSGSQAMLVFVCQDIVWLIKLLEQLTPEFLIVSWGAGVPALVIRAGDGGYRASVPQP